VNGWGSGAAYWMLSSFFFAAVAANVLMLDGDSISLVSDAYTRARTRLGPTMRIALLTWTLFFIARGLSILAIIVPLVRRVPHDKYWILDCAVALMLLIVTGLLARFGFTIPVLMQDSTISLREAMRNSLKRTENWEPFFMVFVAKSVVVVYCLYWLAGYGMDLLWQRGLVNSSALSWIDSATYIIIAAIAEPPLFIALTVLHNEMRPRTPGTAPAPIH
jgi:hypothetical protein